MSTARVIHFGSDDCQHVQSLRHVGYEVRLSDSLDGLRRDLQGNGDVDAVMVAEGERRTTERAAAVVRRYSGAPLILFRRSSAPLNVKRFDRVYAASVPATRWLFETAVVVEQCKELRAASELARFKSEQLRHESEAVRAKSEWQRARSRELTRKLPLAWPTPDETDNKD